jgi:hypothetical protein
MSAGFTVAEGVPFFPFKFNQLKNGASLACPVVARFNHIPGGHMKLFKHTVAGIALLASFGATAASYDYNETFTGAFALNLLGTPYVRTETMSVDTSSLPDWLASVAQDTITSFTGSSGGLSFCGSAGSCQLAGGNALGSYSGSFVLDHYTQVAGTTEFSFAGSFSFTGGTGVFDGISGGGTFSGSDFYASGVAGTTVKSVVGTISLPVPEPASVSMMLAGLAVIAGVARRRC